MASTTLRIKGGPQLRARMLATLKVPPAFAGEWAEDAASRMRRTAPHAERPASKRFTTKANELRGAVYGAFWWIFVDRGTKAHDITPRNKKALRFEDKGRTIFAKRVHKGRQRRRPFITKAAQDALSGSQYADLLVKTWNTRRLVGSHKRFL